MGEQAFQDFPQDDPMAVGEPALVNEIPKPRRRRATTPGTAAAASPAEALRALARLVEVLIGTMPSDARDEATAFLKTVERL